MADILAMLAPKRSGMGAMAPDDEAPPSSNAGGGSAKKLAMLAVQAIKDGDDDAAADAFVGMAKACMKADYSEPET